jgi:hypothetical protein
MTLASASDACTGIVALQSLYLIGNAGGHIASNWAVLAATAMTSKDTFRKRVIDPRSFNPVSLMPPHPTFDEQTFNALEAYFKATMLIE